SSTVVSCPLSLMPRRSAWRTAAERIAFRAMPHPLVEQLRFTRSEWLRGLEGVTEEDAAVHHGPNPMNSIGWIVGHLTWQEQRYLLWRSQGRVLFPEIQERYAYGAPMSTPSLAEMLTAWRTVTAAADPYLDGLGTAGLEADLPLDGRSVGQSVGSALRRLTYHYWFHIGEIQAIRQMLGQRDLPEYVGDIEEQAPYRREDPVTRG
ncbi:MAG: DinB family protein, partial [Dehalococcoidia bacterium]